MGVTLSSPWNFAVSWGNSLSRVQSRAHPGLVWGQPASSLILHPSPGTPSSRHTQGLLAKHGLTSGRVLLAPSPHFFTSPVWPIFLSMPGLALGRQAP